LWAYSCSPKFLSQPLKEGESTPKVRSGEISSIMRTALHQPGRRQ
jgi:hypothetical protein